MRKGIKYNLDTNQFNITDKIFSNITNDQLKEFDLLLEDLKELNPTEYNGRYDKLMFRNQAKTYFIYYPPKSGGGAPHIELRVHPDSTYDFTEIFDPFKYEGSLKVRLADKRFKVLNISHPDYDLLATFFSMVVQGKPVIKLGNCEAYLEDKKMTFDKIISVMNNFEDRFFFNDLKKVVPVNALNDYYLSKDNSNSVFTAKFIRGAIRFSLITDKRPVMTVELTSKGEINVLVDEERLQGVIGNENNYKEVFECLLNSGRSGFTRLNVTSIDGGTVQSLHDLFHEYETGDPKVFKVK